MAFMTTTICRLCGKLTLAPIGDHTPICTVCLAKEEKQSTELRIRKIEEWIHNHEKQISVRLNTGLDTMTIDWVQQIEQEIDEVMVKHGFCRTTTSKEGQRLEFNYQQFGVARGDLK